MTQVSSSGSDTFVLDQQISALRPGKIVCVGRNYAAHAAELNNPVPEEPILFIKPASSLVMPDAEGLTSCPLHDAGSQHDESLHYETEIALLIGEQIGPDVAGDHRRLVDSVAGIGVALDLTKRELQSVLKKQGHPWELSKAFDGSCPVGSFVSPGRFIDKSQLEPNALWTALGFDMRFNGELRQQGRASQMLTGCIELLSHISRHFTLNPGDLVLTGTPAGVGALMPGAVLEVSLGLAAEGVDDAAAPLASVQQHTFRFAEA
ncbi:fumarylacetoacetate hydrolase family protein [Allohahella marinimesophila]|uniref:Fumarylacetoacetate hydrolase family protein n=1 Tax=Allohahella marinimesophila TaxID=1054972 RepID=A0ABP7PRV0_9GAMM